MHYIFTASSDHVQSTLLHGKLNQVRLDYFSNILAFKEMSNFNDDVRPEDFENLLDGESFALGEQTADIPLSSSVRLRSCLL
jgi:hypothetical protein